MSLISTEDGGESARPRKAGLLAGKPNLPSHSAMSLMKKAAAGIHGQSSSLQKALYADRCLLDAHAKYVLVRSEATEAWSTYMEEESNPAIKGLYKDICELDEIIIMLQQRHSLQLSERRRLFKQLSKGEQETAKLQKLAASAASRVTQAQKQLDDSLLKKRSNKVGYDLKKLRVLEDELAKAVRLDSNAQRRYTMAVENHKKHKYNEIRKMMTNLASAEVQLYTDCWKIAEVKSEICKLYMDKAYSQLEEVNIHRAADDSRAAISGLCKELGTVVAEDAQLERPVIPPRRHLSQQTRHDDQNPAPPSAPSIELLDLLGPNPLSEGQGDRSTASDQTIESDSDSEDYNTEYIYEFNDADFDDDENACYQNVEVPSDRQYLKLINGSNLSIPSITEGEEEEEGKNEEEEDIFGTFASLNLAHSSSAAGQRMTATDSSQHREDRDTQYGRVWDYRTETGNTSRDTSNGQTPDLGNLRYVSHPGSVGDRPAMRNQMSDLEAELRRSLQRFQEQKKGKAKQRAPPPPVPPLRRN